MAAVWCVPGVPLEGGRGWRIWYCRAGSADFTPEPVRVSPLNDGSPLEVRQSHRLLPPVPGLNRRVAMVEVELPRPEPNRTFRLEIAETDQEYHWPTLPAAIPPEGLSLLMASCFWRNDDKDGTYRAAVETVLKLEKPRPVMKILMGDQVYLDWPPPGYRADAVAQEVDRRYREYWGDAEYQRLLAACPNLMLCDDHEFWNDYPERQVHLPYTWTEEGRDKLGRVMSAYYDAFQHCLNGSDTPWKIIDLPPASLFVADSRSTRSTYDDGKGHFFQEDQFQALEAWQKNLTGPGLLVIGQPLFQKDGDWRDHSLSNFDRDYRRLLGIIEGALRGDTGDKRPHDILVLSGDIHTARHAVATLPDLPDVRVHELISSPASRIGPFVTNPDPELPPESLGGNGASPWKVHVVEYPDTPFPSVDNNLGVIQLLPADKASYHLRVSFRSYRIRPYHRPAWQFWDRPDKAPPGQVQLYEYRDFNLR